MPAMTADELNGLIHTEAHSDRSFKLGYAIGYSQGTGKPFTMALWARITASTTPEITETASVKAAIDAA